MRLKAQMKLGYYPADPDLAGRIGRCMSWPADKLATVLDPCAGCGEAVEAFVPEAHRVGVHTIELAKNRAEACRDRFGDRALWGAFEQARISERCFSAAWVNPPFDDEIGGGKRCELEFLQRVTPLLVDGGILVLVCPERVLVHYRMRQYLNSHYGDLRVFSHPETARPGYADTDVVFAIGAKLKDAAVIGQDGPDVCHALSPFPLDVCYVDGLPQYWTVPPGRLPRTWEQTGMTDEELVEALLKSPLWSKVEAGPVELGQPLLPLKLGHIPMVLASGRLNGEIADHIARATLTKAWHTIEVREKEVQVSGRTRVVEQHIQREKIQLRIRCLARRAGKVSIHDFA